MALRVNVCQFKHDETTIQVALSGRQAPESGQALDEAFCEIQDSINHTHELLEALAQVTGEGLGPPLTTDSTAGSTRPATRTRCAPSRSGTT
jgi:hypothetical protein